MNKLEQLLNEPECPKLSETETPKQEKKLSAAASKANSLAAQEITIASACAGSALFRSAKDFLADIPKAKGYKDEIVSAAAPSKN